MAVCLIVTQLSILPPFPQDLSGIYALKILTLIMPVCLSVIKFKIAPKSHSTALFYWSNSVGASHFDKSKSEQLIKTCAVLVYLDGAYVYKTLEYILQEV